MDEGFRGLGSEGSRVDGTPLDCSERVSNG